MIDDWAVNLVADLYHLQVENGVGHAIRISGELETLCHCHGFV
jgi:hypothetical protein